MNGRPINPKLQKLFDSAKRLAKLKAIRGKLAKLLERIDDERRRRATLLRERPK